jgi:hypothetical protein
LSTCNRCGYVGVITKLFVRSAARAAKDEDNSLDLTIPANAALASPRQLRLMAPAQREILINKLSPQDCRSLDSTRLAAINPLHKIVPFEGDDEAPLGLPEYHEFMLGDCKHVSLKLSPCDRYYLIIRGVKFCGVVRGSHLHSIHAVSGALQNGNQSVNTRAGAEFAWLTAFYAGTCARVIDTIVHQELAVFA